MKAENFEAFMNNLVNLTPHQRGALSAQLNDLTHKQESHALIEARVSSNRCCPKCASEQVVRWGSASGLQRYRCRTCKSTFNALTGTPLARLRHKEKWLQYSEQLAQGTSTRNSAKQCTVHRNTAFRWRHRFLTSPSEQKPNQLKGIVEADETFFRESFKGQKRGLTRSAHGRGMPAAKRGLSSEQIPVLVCRDRSGATTDCMLEKDDKAHLCAVMKPLLAGDCILCSDSSKAMMASAREMGVTHRPINLSAGIRVIAKVYHLQNVNAYDCRLKEWMIRFHGVATRHLSHYLGWRRLIDSAKTTLSSAAILNAALGVRRDQQLTVT